jgi:hypothetical protein
VVTVFRKSLRIAKQGNELAQRHFKAAFCHEVEVDDVGGHGIQEVCAQCLTMTSVVKRVKGHC